MTISNLGESNESTLAIQSVSPKKEISEELEREMLEQSVVSGNEVAKLLMAKELMTQGLTVDAICRVLNMHPDDF